MGRLGQGRLFFFWKAYLPIENTLNGKRPRLVHGPRAGPGKGGSLAAIGGRRGCCPARGKGDRGSEPGRPLDFKLNLRRLQLLVAGSEAGQ